MAAPTGATAAHETEWCTLYAQGLSYAEIGRRFGVTGENILYALRKPANRKRVENLIAEIEEAALIAARHNIAASVNEKCRLRLGIAQQLGIADPDSTERVSINAAATIRDFLEVDRALLNHLESAGERRRKQAQESRTDELHIEELAVARMQRKAAEQALTDERSRDSVASAETTPRGDETLPDNSRTYR